MATVDYCTYHQTVHYEGHESGVCRLITRPVKVGQEFPETTRESETS